MLNEYYDTIETLEYFTLALFGAFIIFYIYYHRYKALQTIFSFVQRLNSIQGESTLVYDHKKDIRNQLKVKNILNSLNGINDNINYVSFLDNDPQNISYHIHELAKRLLSYYDNRAGVISYTDFKMHVDFIKNALIAKEKSQKWECVLDFFNDIAKIAHYERLKEYDQRDYQEMRSKPSELYNRCNEHIDESFINNNLKTLTESEFESLFYALNIIAKEKLITVSFSMREHYIRYCTIKAVKRVTIIVGLILIIQLWVFDLKRVFSNIIYYFIHVNEEY
ncbi:MAG: hypothetical protein KQI78_14500 [Deltaproteobacteria bacterium]|nr:hypothetical protein [Deltaproteobacteria bacterium]